MLLLTLLAFVIGAGAVFGGYVALTRLPAVLAERRLDRRLQEVSMPLGPEEGERSDESVVKRAKEGPLPGLDKAISQTRAGTGLGRLIEQSGVRTTASAIFVMCVTLAAVAGMMALVFVPKFPMLAPVAAVIAALLPFFWLRFKRSRRIAKFEEQFPEALDLLSRAVRAGHAFQTAMGMVADELPEPVGPEFKKTFDQQNYGLPLREALNQLTERVALLDVRFFVTSVVIQRETGGNLAEILDNLASVIRERFKIRRQIRVHTAHGRFTGWVLMAVPAFLGVALNFINPEHMGTLFHERLGQNMIIAAIVMQIVGYFWIKKIIDIEV
jgi:tight adherence protein B